MKHRNLIAIRVRVRELGLLTTAKRKAVLLKRGFDHVAVARFSPEDVLMNILMCEFNGKDILIWRDSR